MDNILMQKKTEALSLGFFAFTRKSKYNKNKLSANVSNPISKTIQFTYLSETDFIIRLIS